MRLTRNIRLAVPIAIAVALAAWAMPAWAAVYEGAPLSQPDLQAKLVDGVAARMQDAAIAHIRDLRRSLARGGHGYCGRVSVDGATPYQPFHVVVGDDGALSILFLPASGDPPGIGRAEAEQLLANLGCAP